MPPIHLVDHHEGDDTLAAIFDDAKEAAREAGLDDDLSEVRLRRLVELVETTIEGAPDDARLDLLRVAKGASLVDLLAGQAEVGDGGGSNLVPLRNEVCAGAGLPDFPPFLRRIVFVGEPASATRRSLASLG